MIRVQKTRDIERMRILAGLEDSREANGLLKESAVPTNSILGESTDSDKDKSRVAARVMKSAKYYFGKKACKFVADHIDDYLEALEEDYYEEGTPGDYKTDTYAGILENCKEDPYYLNFLWDNGIEVDGEIVDSATLEDMDEEDLDECGDFETLEESGHTDSDKDKSRVAARVMKSAKYYFGKKACKFVADHIDDYLEALEEDYYEEGTPGDYKTDTYAGILENCKEDPYYLNFLWDNGIEVDGEIVDSATLEDMDEEDLDECGDFETLEESGYTDEEDDFDTSFEDSVVSRASRDKKARKAAEKDDFVDDDDDDDPGFVDPEDIDDDEVPGDTKMGKASGSDVYNKLQHSDTIEIYADDDQLNKFTLNGNPRRIAYLNQQLRQAQKKANYEETKVYLCFDRGTYKPKFFKPRDEQDLVAVITPDGSESYD